MTVEALSMTPSFSVDTAFTAAPGIADIGPSFENFAPNLSSILESDRYIPGEIVRDFTTKLVSWVPEEPALDQPVEHLPDTVHLPGEVTDETPDSHLGGGLDRPPREVIYFGGGAEESKVITVTASAGEQKQAVVEQVDDDLI